MQSFLIDQKNYFPIKYERSFHIQKGERNLRTEKKMKPKDIQSKLKLKIYIDIQNFIK